MKTFNELIQEGVSIDDAKLQTSVFFVEATHCEQYYLWNDWHERVDWKQDGSGFGICIGHINKKKTKPVFVSFFFVEINGKRVCFYECTSRFVDHTMVENYILERYPVKYDGGTRRAMTDAMNFHNCVNAIIRNEF